MTTTQNEPVISGDKIDRLQARESALMNEANRLRARAEHLERVRHSYSSQLRRRQDTHEKVVLGALVKKAGLDVCRVDGATAEIQPLNGVVLSSFDCRVAGSSASYDRELILGGLLWLASVLHGAPGEAATVPTYDVLREAGRLAGANVSDKKSR